MGVLDFVLMGVGLAMDAFAVAVCKGLAMKKISARDTMLIALFFGGFQALMPALGWLLGSRFAAYIDAVDHWIAFGLLLYIGGKMAVEAVREMRGGSDPEAEAQVSAVRVPELLLLAVATSIDAFAVGITLAFFDTNVPLACGVIGLVTAVISTGGVFLGHLFGLGLKNKAQLFGGVVLIFLGVRILVTGLLG